MDGHSLIKQYWRACEERDWEAFGRTVAPDVVYRDPQTREIVRGRADYVAFNQTYPGDWHLTVERVIARDDEGVSWTSFAVGDETMTGLCFFRFGDGLITEIDDFWPEPYEPPTREVPVVDRY
ncbi:nuclear transport factor 2 family protein [Janibacter limosus]|uniref:Nuclear transport factor 2 family protein n=1 Tax=Janibacter limosus TaxID=53458 RepID=A0AC61U553_9MICO|nr:nuclear transport factor 2 family protein [Janibacter limosus]UUZ45083.1 nuclear transport factor 2 family protein [Janibacter limosus]